MLRMQLLAIAASSVGVLLAGCGDEGGTGPEPIRERTAAEQLSDRPVAVKTAAIAPQFFDQELAEPAAAAAMTPEAAEAYIQNILDQTVDAARVRARMNDPTVQGRVPAVAMRLALAYISELLPEVWEQFMTAQGPSGQPLVGVLDFSRGSGDEWDTGAVYAQVQPIAGTDQLAYIINDLYVGEDPRAIGTIIAHEVLTHTSAHNSVHAEAIGAGIQAHLYARIVASDPSLLITPTRLKQILNQLAVQYMMGTPSTPGSTPAEQGIRSSNRNRPLVVTSNRLAQTSFLALFGALGNESIPGNEILGRAYQRLLGAAAPCPTGRIDSATTACLDEQIGAWSSDPNVLQERLRIADLFTLDLKKTTR